MPLAETALPDRATAPRTLRHILREATHTAHLRLHGHPGFGAVQKGTIDVTSYRTLLCRLYGFHMAFEAAAGCAPERSLWLAEDLRTLGLTDSTIAALPRCDAMPRLDTQYRRLGAIYVAEGSTLGGRELAKRLDHLFAGGERNGRRFFSGRAADTGNTWRAFCDRLDGHAVDDAARVETTTAAIETFAAFEDWFRDWNVTARIADVDGSG